jgi:hypothetical protein
VNPYRYLVAEQFAPAEVEAEAAEADLLAPHGIDDTSRLEVFRSLNKDLKAPSPVPSSTITVTAALPLK